MDLAILKNIAQQVDLTLLDSRVLTGGDINDVYLLTTKQGEFVIKINDKNRYPNMFEKEADGLQKLASTKTFRIPKVIDFGSYENNSFLVLEYISSGKTTSGFWCEFAEKLAQLHQHQNSHFGYISNNYIGKLVQKNPRSLTATDFYIHHRLAPQFEIAQQNGFTFKNLHQFYTNIEKEIPSEKASLIHGDLWSGNYMIDEQNQPVLIDPAVCFAPREMDLAMMHLFGGFPSEVFEEYDAVFPLVEGWKNRVELFQLYYLLVHLNLFGSGYFASVNRIVQRYL
ncbi:MAG: fructosamine kinase family protein [Bacteroidota bacterium]